MTYLERKLKPDFRRVQSIQLDDSSSRELRVGSLRLLAMGYGGRLELSDATRRLPGSDEECGPDQCANVDLVAMVEWNG